MVISFCLPSILCCFKLTILGREYVSQSDIITISIIHLGKGDTASSHKVCLNSSQPNFYLHLISHHILTSSQSNCHPFQDLTIRFWNHRALGSHAKEPWKNSLAIFSHTCAYGLGVLSQGLGQETLAPLSILILINQS